MWRTFFFSCTSCLIRGKHLVQTIRDTGKGLWETPLPFELEGMLYYSTLVELELIGQVLSFKCNNVKEIQTEYHSPYKTRQTFLHLCS